MNCLEFRRAVGANPLLDSADVLEHASQCASCARYRDEMQRMESLIGRALKIDTQAPVAKPAAAPRKTLRWGLAASALLAVALAVFWLGLPRDSLAQEVVAHVMHEPGSLEPGNEIDETALAAVLAEVGLTLRPGMQDVTYAMFCPFRGHQVPHFVVRTDRGPVTVMLLTQEPAIDQPRRFQEEGFDGVIMPAPRGLIAVLGRDAPLDEVAARVLAAVDYRADVDDRVEW